MRWLQSPAPIMFLWALPVYIIMYCVINCVIKPIVGSKFTDQYMGTAKDGMWSKETLISGVKGFIVILLILLVIWLLVFQCHVIG